MDSNWDDPNDINVILCPLPGSTKLAISEIAAAKVITSSTLMADML